jgi:predicted glycosyl hydrolase (DUF1957 family)
VRGRKRKRERERERDWRFIIQHERRKGKTVSSVDAHIVAFTRFAEKIWSMRYITREREREKESENPNLSESGNFPHIF